MKLVHVSGKAQTKENLQDLEFGVVAQDSYKLLRKVEMYQWKESYQEAVGANPAFYSYKKVWSDEPIDSSQFKNIGFENPDVERWVF